MNISNDLLAELTRDLGLDVPFVKGQTISVNKCWHFYTNGADVDAMFYDEADFVSAMNRIFVTRLGFKVVILAFTLMDTHVHFVLYGELEECVRFMKEFIRLTSQHIENRHGEQKKLSEVNVSYQPITDDRYLKTVICYTLKNAPVGGLGFNALDYPWSSGPLYFKRSGLWCSPAWDVPLVPGSYRLEQIGFNERRTVLQTRKTIPLDTLMIGQLVFPGEYVAAEVVERLFKTCRSFNFFMCSSREDDVESRGGCLSQLTMPIQELRQHKRQMCAELFGTEKTNCLEMTQRLRLARALRSRYNCSPKQIAKVCGLVYNDVKDRL